jgi:hypothetical protein
MAAWQGFTGGAHLFVLCLKRLDELFLEEEDNFLDVARGDHVEGDGKGFASDLHIGGDEDAQEVHDEVAAEVVLVLGPQSLDAVEDDELDVVIGLFEDELDVARGDGCDRLSAWYR